MTTKVKKMKKIFLSLMVILLVGALSACGTRKDGNSFNSSAEEEAETQVSNEVGKSMSTDVEEVENESTVYEEEVTSERNYPGADTVEIVNLRGDETTVYKLTDGTYLDRTERHYTYNGTDTWTDEDGVEWNEIVKSSADDNSPTSVDEVSADEAWKEDLEKSLFDNYGVIPKYYEDLGDGIYQVYVEVGGEVIPLVTVDSETGDYQVEW